LRDGINNANAISSTIAIGITIAKGMPIIFSKIASIRPMVVSFFQAFVASSLDMVIPSPQLWQIKVDIFISLIIKT
jgi:hypothetical protein